MPIDQILLLLPTTSYSIKDDTITLAEEQYCKVKEKLEQESTTIDEESFEIDHEADSTVRTYMNRRGRAVKRPNYLDAYYI